MRRYLNAVPEAGLARCDANHRENERRDLPWLAPQKGGGSVAIVGGGASAADYCDEILAFDGRVIAINGAYPWLAEKGRVADAVVLLDPTPRLTQIVGPGQGGTTFYVATCCDPSTFDALGSQDVVKWQAAMSDDAPGVPGGPSALTRAPVIAMMLGFTAITVFGADCCFDGDTSHVYGGAIPPDATEYDCGGAVYRTTPALLMQAEYLADLVPVLPIAVRGWHLTAAMIEQNKGGAGCRC